MLTRRTCLKTIGGGLAAIAAAGSERASAAQTHSKVEPSKLAMPGPYRGRVAAVESPGAILSGKYQPENIRTMMRRGMVELTGADTWADAWRRFFEPGDVVGIKVNPVGQPHVISDASVVREIIAGLESAGVKRKDIVVYDRYRAQFFGAGFDKWLSHGVRAPSAAEDYYGGPQGIEGYDPHHHIYPPPTPPRLGVGKPTAR